MRLRVTHVSRLKYSERVTEQVMECRLGPLSDDDQRWDRFELRVKPTSRIASYVDAFGNLGYLVTLAARAARADDGEPGDDAPHGPVRLAACAAAASGAPRAA